jgi:hypothetical protein
METLCDCKIPQQNSIAFEELKGKNRAVLICLGEQHRGILAAIRLKPLVSCFDFSASVGILTATIVFAGERSSRL